jgi:hypothetical protein
MSLRTVLGGFGAAVGFIYGGPGGASWGFMIGSTLGSVIDPGTVKGPSIGEIANQTAQEGGPRPIVIGISPPMPGNVIAQSDPRIVKKKKGGKGGPKVVTETVFRTYAVGVCEGPIGAFRRVWRNNVLVYDTTGLSALTADDNASFLEQARFFLGTFEQLPSSDLEAVFGVGTTPAHRGTAYMVMKDEDLTELRGAIPQWTFQVTNNTPDVLLSNDALYPWLDSNTTDPRNPKNTHEYRYAFLFGGRIGQDVGDAGPGAWRATLEAAEADGNAKTDPPNQYVHRIGWGRQDQPDDAFILDQGAVGIFSSIGANWLSVVFDIDADEREILQFSYNYYLPAHYTGMVGHTATGFLVCSKMPEFTPPIISADGVQNWWSSLSTSPATIDFCHRDPPARIRKRAKTTAATILERLLHSARATTTCRCAAFRANLMETGFWSVVHTMCWPYMPLRWPGQEITAAPTKSCNTRSTRASRWATQTITKRSGQQRTTLPWRAETSQLA